MKFNTIDGRGTDINQESLDALRMRLRGPVLLPGSPVFDESCTLWNGMINRKPALIVRCTGNADVIACVQFARENNILLCIKGGGA